MGDTSFIVLLISAILASQGFWTYILYKVKRRDERNDTGKKADLVILHDLIYKYTQHAILRGYTTFDEFDNVTEMFQVYTEIGGNGTGEKLYEDFCKLEKRPGLNVETFSYEDVKEE